MTALIDGRALPDFRLERLQRRKPLHVDLQCRPSELLAALALRHRDAIRAHNRAIIAGNLPRFGRGG